jgi:hypothetical protein
MTPSSRDEWKKENWYYAHLNMEIHIHEQAQKLLSYGALKAVQNWRSTVVLRQSLRCCIYFLLRRRI